METTKIPTWLIDQMRRAALASAQSEFSHKIRALMKLRGWRYHIGNNEYSKDGITLYFADGKGIFTRPGSGSSKSKIVHKFNILPS